MKIPKSFELFGEFVKVVYVDDLAERTDLIGRALMGSNTIELQKVNKNYSKNKIEQTFIHELNHIIFHKMGEGELSKNEKFVEVFSSLLHQATKTMSY